MNGLYFPVRLVIWPETIVAVIIPATIGNIMKPASVGLAPKTICNSNGKVIMPPNMPTPTKTPRTVAIEKVRDLNSLSGKSAESPAARSARMKATIPTPPIAYIAIELKLAQPHSRPCSATRSNGTTAMTMVIAPSQSMRCFLAV